MGVGSGSHASRPAAVMQKFEPVVLREQPDGARVGDVNSRSLRARLLEIGVGCARRGGTQSRDRTMPEEITRAADQSPLLMTPPVMRTQPAARHPRGAHSFRRQRHD